MRDISADIIASAARGDLEAFERLYRETCDYVYNVAYRITNNREDAEEVSQDVFVRLYRNLKLFDFRSSFKTWLYRVAVNAALNALKRRERESGRRAEFDEKIGEREGLEARISEEGEREAAEALVKSLLSRLNSDQRACVVLRDIEGLSYKEIAETLKININTVRSRLKRARTALVAFGRLKEADIS